MSRYAKYHAEDWAQGKSVTEIRAEIDRCNWRYSQPYPWNGVENATITLERIRTLEGILASLTEGDH